MTSTYTPPTQIPPMQRPPTERRSSSPAFLAGMGLLCVGAIAAIVTAVLLAFGGSHATSAPAPAPSPSSSTVHPTASIETLQRELGQLNYYEGPVDGTMNPQTVQAITYLQRDAHLPQTGQLNAATATALANFLAHGNNQMGG
jgi:peptidoglycan hydrolase-like protein with peptidoglycan-binding domain